MTLPSFLDFYGTTDGVFRAVVVFLLALLIIKYSALFEEEYNRKLTSLYVYPWWRLLVVVLMVSAAMWCPRVGILVALAVFFYLSDMNALIQPMTHLDA